MSAPDPKELAERVLRLAKDIMQGTADELAVYYNDNFGTDTRGVVPRERNTTDRLRVVGGDLARAVSGKDERGAIFSVKVDGDAIVVESGVDLGDIPYARVHELGGKAGRQGAVSLRARPYLLPGMTEFNRKAFPRYIQRLIKLLGAQ